MDYSAIIKKHEAKIKELSEGFLWALEELKKTQAELARTQVELKLYRAKFEQSSQAYNQLLFAFKQSQRHVFGASSERFLDNSPSQGDFFSTIAPKSFSQIDDDKPDPNPPKKTKNKKRKKKSKDFTRNLPHREVIIPAKEKIEGDQFLRYEITELFNYIPPVYEIIVQKREIIVRKNQTNNTATIITAPNPLRFLPQTKVTESFLAHVIVGKLYDRQPLYHQEKKFKQRFDFICPRNKLARWTIQSAERLQPIVNLLRDEVFNYDIAGCDPTHLQVLNEPGRKAEQKSYLYSIRGGPPERLVNLFEYNAEEHKDFLVDWFSGYSGYLQVDGQNIFESFLQEKNIQLVFCNSHARRKFEPIAQTAKQPGLANQIMQYYRAIYKIEREAKDRKLNFLQRYALRQEKTKPIMETMFAWMKEVGPTTLPQSPLGKAFHYALTREKSLTLCLEDGRLEIDSNLVEQQNKNFALARNNFMFSYSVDGAHALGVHMSLIFTALAHGLDPYHYYVHIMHEIPNCAKIEEYENLLPWNISPSSVSLVHQKAA